MLEKQFRFRNELKRLGKHGATYGIAQILRRLVGFLLIPLYTHYLSTGDYGILQLVGVTIEIVGIVISLGIGDAIYRFYYDTDDPGEKNRLISSACIGVFLMATPILVVLSCFSWKAAGWILEAREQGIYILLALGNLWFNTMGELFFIYLRVKERSAAYLVISILRTTVALCLIIYLIVFMGKGLIGIFLGNLIISAVLCVVVIPYLLSQVGVGFSVLMVRNMLRYSLPIIPANLCSLVVNVSDRYFIKGYLSIADVGIYTLGYRLGNVIHYLVRVPFMQIWAPRRFALYREGAPPEMYASIATYFIGLMIFCGLGVSVFVQDIIKVISPAEYWSAATYTPAIALCYILYSLDNHVALGISIAKKTEYWTYVNFGMAGLNLVLNYVLISNYGVWGAVLSTFLAILFKIIALHLVGKRFFAIPFEWFRMLGFLFIAFCLYALSTIVRPESLYLAFSWDSLLVITYVPVLLILGLIKKSEKEGAIVILKRLYSVMTRRVLAERGRL